MLFFCIRFVQNLRICLIINTYIIMENKKNLSSKKKKKFILRTIAWCLLIFSIVLFAIGASLHIKGDPSNSSYFATMGALWIVAFFCHFIGNT